MATRSTDHDGLKSEFTRRRFLAGGMGALGMFWSDWLQASGLTPASGAKAKSVIMIFNCGAPSHIDLWDLKPEAPENIRGPYKPIDTNVPGIQISQLMPELARRTDKLAIVRSVHHKQHAHNSGMYYSIVGKPYPVDSTLINPSRSDLPSFGTLVGWLAQQSGYDQPLPPYFIIPYPHCDSLQYITPGQFGACLGSRFDPFVLDSDPNAANFKVANLGLREGMTSPRMRSRESLLARFESAGAPIRNEAAAALDVNRRKAMSLTMSDDVSRAFDLSSEPDKVRDRYGRHTWGQSHLLSRRLVEAGVPFISCVNGRSIVWDTHKDNFDRLENRLVPPMERAYTALLDDLEDRGMLDSTLVVWMGDFGRTPIINKDSGRDHWPQCYTVVLAGGGIRGGQVVGASDRNAAYPAQRPVTPADIHSTVFTALGYDPHSITYRTADDRPMALSEGEAIRELL